MAQIVIWMLGWLVVSVSPTWAATFFVDAALVVNCTSTNYNFQLRNCTSTGTNNAYTTASVATALAQLNPDDTLYFRGGTYAVSLAIAAQTVTGTAAQPVTIAGYPGETVIFTPNSHLVSSGSATNYILFKNFKADFSLALDERSFFIASSTGLTFEDIEVTGAFFHGFYLGGTGGTTTFRRVKIHGQRSNCGPGVTGSRYYGIYAHNGADILVEDSDIYNNPGGGVQVYPGPWNNVVIRDSRIYENTWCTTSNVGGVIVSAVSGSMGRVEIYNSLIYGQTPGGVGGWGGGITTATTSPYTITNAKFNNNTIYNNQSGNASPAYGINIQGAVTGEAKNNHVVGNETGQILNNSTGSMTVSSNRTTGAIGDCTISTTDFRLKQGTNPCRDAGASVTTRPAPVGVTDIGAYEQGKLESAVVVSKFIEVTTNIMTAPLQPTSGATGFTVTCIGCTGSPVVSQAVLKAGSVTTLQLSISGLSSTGTCSLSLGSTTLADSSPMGTLNDGQGLNSITGLSVSGTCENTVAGGGAPTPSYSRFLLDEGSGTVATDDTGGGHHGTVSAGVTWVSSSSGTGVTIPADTTYRQITTTFGAGVDPTTQSFAQCIDVEPDLSAVPSIMMSAGSNGTNQRAYVGITSVGGQPQWGIGVQGSGFTTGSEFVAAAQRSTVCVTFDSVTDTATLWVDGVKGTQAGKSVKTYTSYGLVGNLRVGNDGTFTTNNGGFTVYTVWTWNSLPSDADLIALYESEFPSGTPLACHEQKTHKWELTRVDGSGTPVSVGTTGGSVDVVDGGGVALVIQIDCTTTAGAPLALRFYYSTDGVTYSLEIPTSLGTDGIALWGIDTSASLNDGNVTCCITGALTPTTGSTVKTVNSTPVINLAQNQSWTVRVLLRVGSGLVGQSRYILLKQDNGLDLANGYAIGGARINVIANRAGTGF